MRSYKIFCGSAHPEFGSEISKYLDILLSSASITRFSDGEINYKLLQLMNRDEAWLMKKLKEAGISDYHEVFYCVVEKERFFIIKKG